MPKSRRIYAVAGAYGCYNEFEELLSKIAYDGFDTNKDELVIIGPLIGHGCTSDLIFDKLADLEQNKVRVTHVLAWQDLVFREVLQDETIFEHLKEFERPDPTADRGTDEGDLEIYNFMSRWAATGGHAAAFAYAQRGKIAIPTTVSEILTRSVKYYRSGKFLFIPAPVPSTVCSLRTAVEELEQDQVLYPVLQHGRINGDLKLLALPDDDEEAFVIAGGEQVNLPVFSERAALIDTGLVRGGSLTAVRLPDFKLISVQAAADYRFPVPNNFVREGVSLS